MFWVSTERFFHSASAAAALRLQCAGHVGRYFDLIREMKNNIYNHRLRLFESAREYDVRGLFQKGNAVDRILI
jgi:hypothetical protein